MNAPLQRLADERERGQDVLEVVCDAARKSIEIAVRGLQHFEVRIGLSLLLSQGPHDQEPSGEREHEESRATEHFGKRKPVELSLRIRKLPFHLSPVFTRQRPQVAEDLEKPAAAIAKRHARVCEVFFVERTQDDGVFVDELPQHRL